MVRVIVMLGWLLDEVDLVVFECWFVCGVVGGWVGFCVDWFVVV